MNDSYYLAVNGVPQGPYTKKELCHRAIQPADLIYKEGMEKWTPACEVPELSSIFKYSSSNILKYVAGGVLGAIIGFVLLLIFRL